jgi:hemerythrin-like metal-binding protein
MAVLDRSGGLSLDLPFMDQDCKEFLGLLALVDKADNAQLPSAWRDLVACAAENFAREDTWMRTTGYASRKQHAILHRVVLEVMREGALQAEEGRLLQAREMAHQLRDWYAKHVQTMDAALALHLRSARFDPANAGVQAQGSPRVCSGLRDTADPAAPSH